MLVLAVPRTRGGVDGYEASKPRRNVGMRAERDGGRSGRVRIVVVWIGRVDDDPGPEDFDVEEAEGVVVVVVVRVMVEGS